MKISSTCRNVNGSRTCNHKYLYRTLPGIEFVAITSSYVSTPYLKSWNSNSYQYLLRKNVGRPRLFFLFFQNTKIFCNFSSNNYIINKKHILYTELLFGMRFIFMTFSFTICVSNLWWHSYRKTVLWGSCFVRYWTLSISEKKIILYMQRIRQQIHQILSTGRNVQKLQEKICRM